MPASNANKSAKPATTKLMIVLPPWNGVFCAVSPSPARRGQLRLMTATRRSRHRGGGAPRATAVPSETAATEPTQRDRHLQSIAEKGRLGWQRMSGYNERSRVEASIGRYKQVIGDGLRFRNDERRATEIAVAAYVMNRMLGLGRPLSIRIA